MCLVEGKCTDRGVVYGIICELCKAKALQEHHEYDGETGRPLDKRFKEHYLSASNPTAKSYKDKPLAKHYSTYHPNTKPQLSLRVIEKATSTNNRKIREARIINKNNPSMNNRHELTQVKQFLVQ